MEAVQTTIKTGDKKMKNSTNKPAKRNKSFPLGVICTQANRVTTIGKVYPVIGVMDDNILIINCDNGVNDYVNNDTFKMYCGSPTGIACFEPINCDKQCYFAQPSIARIEAQAITVLATLEVTGLNPNAAVKIRETMKEDGDLRFTGNFYQTSKHVIKDNQISKDWLIKACEIAHEYANVQEV